MANKQPWYHEIIVSFDLNEHFKYPALNRIQKGLMGVLKTTKGALKPFNEVLSNLDTKYYKMELQLLFVTTTGRVSEKAMGVKIKKVLEAERCIEQGSVFMQSEEPEPGDPADLL
jgi:hypothetical protein